MPEGTDPQKDILNKACVGNLNSGEEMKMVVPESLEEIEVLPEFEENKDKISHAEKGEEKFKQFDLVDDCSEHFFRSQAGKELGSSQVRTRTWTIHQG